MSQDVFRCCTFSSPDLIVLPPFSSSLTTQAFSAVLLSALTVSQKSNIVGVFVCKGAAGATGGQRAGVCQAEARDEGA